MDQITHRTLEVNAIQMHIAEQGTGPLVLLLHGFPSLWYTWRKQIPVIANAGYHVVAPDMRGYGQTEAPADPSKYTLLHVVGDVVHLIDSLGETQAYVVGHDWGAVTAWYLALFRPDLVKCVVTLSVGFVSRHPKLSLLDILRSLGDDKVYMLEWQEPGKAEADFGKDIKLAFEKLYSYRDPEVIRATDDKSILDNIPAPDGIPSWMTEHDIQYYVDTFSKTGFTPALNWYRNLQSTWELTAPWTEKGTSVPALVIIGDLDLGIKFVGPYLESPLYNKDVPNGEYKIVPGYAHFILEEAPETVNGYILEYLKKH